MQQLFWKKIEIDNKKHGRPPKLEEYVNLIYLIDQNNYLYFGGRNQFNTKDLIHEEKTPSPPKTEGISFKIAPSKNTIIQRVNSPNSNQECQDYVYILDPGTYQWTIKKTTGKCPPRRTHAQVWYEAPLLFVYGGVTLDNKTASDMYILNTEKYVWKRFFSLEGPPGRLDFGFSSQSNIKYLVGGASMPENLLLDDVWSLDFESVAWHAQQTDIAGITWKKLPFENMKPIKGHTILQVSDSDLFLYGGFDKSKQCLDICLLLDVDSFTISQLNLKGQSPGPRAYHQILVVKENLICLYGGYDCNENQVKTNQPLNDLYLLNLNEGFWSKPMTGGYLPQPRFGFAMSGNQNELHGEIIILGGQINDGSVDQAIYILHELDMDVGEAWGELNDSEKNKYDSYREMKKENKNVNIPTLTLEYDEAEKFILEQKRSVGEREKDLKLLQNQNRSLEEKGEQLQLAIDDAKQQLDVDLEGLKIETSELNSKADENQMTINKIMQLLIQERKKKKLAKGKQMVLQDGFRKTQQYIIELEKVFLKGMSDNLFEYSINEDILMQIESKKQEHRIILEQFKAQLVENQKIEDQVKAQMKTSKDVLKQFVNLSEVFHNSLQKEDKDFLEKKI